MGKLATIEKTSSNTYRYVESETIKGIKTDIVDETYCVTKTDARLVGGARESPIVEAIRNAFPETKGPSFTLKKVNK